MSCRINTTKLQGKINCEFATLFAIILSSNGLPLFLLQKYVVNIQRSCYKTIVAKIRQI